MDDLLGDLSSGKNAPKTGGGAKGSNASAAGSGNTKNNGASGADISNYAGQIKSAIESKFYDAASYSGKTCTLRIKLAPDGMLLNIQSEGGDLRFVRPLLQQPDRLSSQNRLVRRYMKYSKMRRWTSNLSDIFPRASGEKQSIVVTGF